MSLSETHAMLKQHIRDNIINTRHKPVVAFPNANFNKPKDVRDPWIRVKFNDGERTLVGFGHQCLYRFNSSISIQIFTETRTGETKALEIADDLIVMLRALKCSGIRIGQETIRDSEEDTTYYQMNLFIPFTRDLIQ